MADPSAWQTRNEAYLAQTFALQRLRLQRFASAKQPSGGAESTTDVEALAQALK